jgi:GTPase
VIADIPGLIEGASDGAGLGHEFLAHVERTRLLVHVLDLAPLDGTDPVANFETVERELATHDPRLAALPRILALSKADLVDARTATAARAAWRERLGDEVPVIVTSSAAATGLRELSQELVRRVPEAPAVSTVDAARSVALADGGELAEHRVFRPAAPRAYTVSRLRDGSFVVDGAGIERLVARYDLDNEEAMAHLERRLRGIGVLGALEAEGFTAGDDVRIAGIEFDLDPDT